MRSKLRFTIITIALTLSVLISQVQAHPRVTITADPEVSAETYQNAALAVDLATTYMEKQFSLKLNKDIQLSLLADTDSYENWFVSELNLSRETARLGTRFTHAASAKNVIGVNTSKFVNQADQTFALAHELTHHYQSQEAGTDKIYPYWLYEGMADYIAAQVVENARLQPRGFYSKSTVDYICMITERPRLSELHTTPDWGNAILRYGAFTYSVCDYAVHYLMAKRNPQSLIDYLRLSKSNPEDVAFKKAFGLSLVDFEIDLEVYHRP